ncbi:hypothetical protein QL285_013280 [Trifolium repens]|nr:hypothetical protein QL285_013280 [Trifolium repens]
MDQKQKLESPSEQSRLLSEIPKVIPEMVCNNLSPEDSSRNDKLDQNDLPELAIGEACNSVEQFSTHGDFAQCLDKRTDVVGPKTPVKNNQDDTVFPTNAEELSVHTASQDKDTSQKNPVQYTSNADVIVLSDSDEEDVNIEVTLAGKKGVESPDINIWHCSGIYGSGTRRPVSLSALKRWSESEFDSASSQLEFKVWKTGESEREAMSLRDALKLFFP